MAKPPRFADSNVQASHASLQESGPGGQIPLTQMGGVPVGPFAAIPAQLVAQAAQLNAIQRQMSAIAAGTANTDARVANGRACRLGSALQGLVCEVNVPAGAAGAWAIPDTFPYTVRALSTLTVPEADVLIEAYTLGPNIPQGVLLAVKVGALGRHFGVSFYDA